MHRANILEENPLSRFVSAIRLVWQSSPRLAFANLVLVMLQGILPLVGLYLMKLVIDGVASATAAADKTAAFERIMFYIALAAIAVLFGFLCRALESGVKTTLGQIFSDRMHDILHAKAIELDLQYYQDAEYYDKLALARREAPFRPIYIVSGMIGVTQNGISLLVIIGLLISFHWAILPVLVVCALPGVFLRLRNAEKMHRWRVKSSNLERRGGYYHHIMLDEEYGKEIRLFDLGRLFMDRFREIRQQLLKENIKIVKSRSVGELVTFAGGTLAVFGCYAYIVYRAVHGAITIGDLVMYVGAFRRGESALQSLVGSAVTLYENSLFLATISHFLGLKPKVADPTVPKPVPAPIMEGIVLRDMSFRYPNTRKMILEHINLTIKPGEVIGLVGENGSGKTTLVKLLCRFYDPTEGSIGLDGINLKEFETTALRRHISMVFQDYKRYQATVRENIWYGDIGVSVRDERIYKASKDSGFDDLVAGFKDGYETFLGRWFERGEELSIGQSQKLALARAFLRDAQIMMLDEPTSAMDAKAEYELFKRFRRVAEGRTIILISHRLSTLKMTDRIYVLKDRTIAESGTHEELVENGGTYAKLFKRQAHGYR